MLERTPPGLDEGVVDGHVRLGEDAAQESGLLEASTFPLTLSEPAWAKRSGQSLGEAARRVEQNRDGAAREQAVGDAPGEDPAGEAVDDGVDVRRSILANRLS